MNTSYINLGLLSLTQGEGEIFPPTPRLGRVELAAGAPTSALIWWVIPLLALIGGLAYAVWVSKFEDKYKKQTQRSVGKFKKFQDSFRSDDQREL
mgnify:FL=1